jgi:hypothetical protein
MGKYLRVRNYEKFQNYRDRRPPWIKLYAELLDNYEFCALPDRSQLHLMKIWLVASRCNNLIPNDAAWITRKIGAASPVQLPLLVGGNWLIESDGEEPAEDKWASRYVPDKLAAQVFSRDGDKCVDCGSTEKLELDHVLPISRGGKSELSNLAVRCRSCNRRKRSRDAKERATQLAAEGCASAQGEATQIRSLETETETETEKRRPPSADAPSLPESLNTPAFIAAWERWQTHRREIKHKLTPSSAAAQVKKFETWGTDRAVAAIDHSIEHGWQGVFEPDAKAQGPANARLERHYLSAKDVLNER